jgi:NtrC-family two-component system sensor histidine kinase KinB
MSDYLVPLLVFMLLIATGWALRRRPTPVLWRGHEYRAVLDALEDAILVFDESGRSVYLNRAARLWFGLDEAEHYDTQPLRAQISPADDFLTLRSQGGRASLKIGARHVEAVSQRIETQGGSQVTIVLHDVTASQALLAEERRRVRELAVFNKINQAINASLDLDELLDGILKALKQLCPYTSAAISLWDPKLEQLVVRGCVGPMAQLDDVLPTDRGYAARIVREREPLLLSDTSGQPELGGDPSTRSYVGVPLLAGTNFIGTLELIHDQAGAFSTETLETLRIVVSQTAVAIENARLYSETLIRADEMATLYTLSAATSASLNPDELLEIIVYSISQAIGCDRSAIYIMDNERGVLNLAKARGLSVEFIRHSQNIKPELDGQAQVVLDRYPLIVSDIRQTPTPAQLVPLAEREGFVAFADFPLRGREHVLGALTVYYDRPHIFDEPELELLRTFANQVTLALENAWLYDRTDRALARRVGQLAAVEEIGRELTSTLDLTHVFNLVLQRAMGSTGASAGLLALCAPAGDELELIADRGYPPEALQPYRDEGWPSDHGIVGRVACIGETALVNDVHADPDYVPHLQSTCAQLTVPIIKGTRVLGVVSLESSRAQGFSPDDARFTTQLAELAAIAIDNARLFQEVSQGRDNLQAILDSTRDGILVVDRDARIVLANPMIEELSGLSAQELVGRRASQVITKLSHRAATLLGYPGNRIEEALSLLESMSDTVNKRTYEVPGSPPLCIEQVASPVIDKDGTVVGRLIALRDITEERRVDQMRQDLTDMIIHDLRSPLTAVVGGLQVAGDLFDASADPAMVHHALDMANESCDRLLSLVDSLLDISRLEAGQMPLECQPVLLPRLAQSVIQQMSPLAEHEMVTLQLQTISQIPPVEADHNLISRVLVNLVDNALKHSPRNGTVTIKIAPVSIKEEQSDSYLDETLASPRPARAPSTHLPGRAAPGAPLVRGRHVRRVGGAQAEDADASGPPGQVRRAVRCTVLDMGPGIPVKNRETIFERFTQLGGRRRGAGLGLAFCRLAIQAHGGRIWVEDNPRGRGSAFSFTLPVVLSEVSLPLVDANSVDHVIGSEVRPFG